MAILVVSQYVEHTYATELLAAGGGGIGYLLKDRILDVEDFVDAVRRVAEGARHSTRRSSRNSSPAGAARARCRNSPGASSRCSGSWPRDVERGIATALVLTVGAVEKHIASIFTKLALPQTGTEPPRPRGARLPPAGLSRWIRGW